MLGPSFVTSCPPPFQVFKFVIFCAAPFSSDHCISRDIIHLSPGEGEGSSRENQRPTPIDITNTNTNTNTSDYLRTSPDMPSKRESGSVEEANLGVGIVVEEHVGWSGERGSEDRG